jgi:hypothetical protein
MIGFRMTRETKSNLIFLVIFLALSLPGAVILVKKKMLPGASPAPLSRPDPVRRQLPYMAPQVTSDKVVRYVPPMTRQWLIEVDRSRGGTGEFLVRERQPPLSVDRTVQVLNVNVTDSSVSLIIWNDVRDVRDVIDVNVEIDSRRAKHIDFHAIDVPPEIRRELQDGGFVTPPRRIVWGRATASGPFTKGKSIQVQVKSGDVANPAAKSVNLFTSPGF